MRRNGGHTIRGVNMPATVQMNHLNVPQVMGQRQRYDANNMAMQRAEVAAGREDKAYDDEQKMANLRFLAGGTKVLMDIHEQDRDRFYVAADELISESVARGVEGAEGLDPQLVTIEQVQELNDAAMVALGGQRVNPQNSKDPAKVRQYEFYKENVAGNPENESIWNESTQVDKGQKIVGINMPDGSEIQVNYDPQSGEGYNLTTGERIDITAATYNHDGGDCDQHKRREITHENIPRKSNASV